MNLFKTRFSEADASLIVEYIEAKAEEKAKEASQKGEEHRTGIERLVNKDIDNLRTEMYRVFASKENLAETKADIIKWMFIFWIGQIAATMTIILLFNRK